MLTLQTRAPDGATPTETLTLPFGSRQKSRLRARLDSGAEVAIYMPRGNILRQGELLQADDGTIVAIMASAEELSIATAADTSQLARGAYHLGNRHVQLQIGATSLRYLHDHVLDQMVRELGLTVRMEQAPFEPEAGAYGGGHSHSAGHSHGHDHG